MRCNAERWRQRKFESTAFLRKPYGIISVGPLSCYVAGIFRSRLSLYEHLLKAKVLANAREGPKSAFANATPRMYRPSRAGPALVEVKGNVCGIVKMSCMRMHQSELVPQQ